MSELTKEYFDEQIGGLRDQIGKTNQLIETLAMSTAQQFDRVDQRFDSVDDRLGKIEERLLSVETNTTVADQEHRRLKDHAENNLDQESRTSKHR